MGDKREGKIKWNKIYIPPSNSYVEILPSKDDSIRRWGLWEILCHEGGLVLIKENHRVP